MLLLQIGPLHSYTYANLAKAINKKVFLGFAGFGKGDGKLGHVFLLINEQNKNILFSDAYQYNKMNRTQSTEQAWGLNKLYSDFINYKPDLLMLIKETFLTLHANYSILEDRHITLFELNLSPLEIYKLIFLLEQDLKNPYFKITHQYGIFNNCVTRLIELINQAIDATNSKKMSKKIDYFNEKYDLDIQQNSIESIKNAILNRFPFYLSKILNDHPIVNRKQIINRNKYSLILAQKYQKLSAAIMKLSESCNIANDITQTVRSYIDLVLSNPEQYKLQTMLNFIEQQCKYQNNRLKFSNIKVVKQIVDDKRIFLIYLYSTLEHFNLKMSAELNDNQIYVQKTEENLELIYKMKSNLEMEQK